MQQLFIQFINYVWQLLHVSALHCHPQGAFLVLSNRCSIEEQLIEYFAVRAPRH
jgi:6-phosphogluconolactonase (cycloisomerase 2 family)